MRPYLKIAYNWLWLRWKVFWWCFWRGRLGEAGDIVAKLEALHLARVRRDFWKLTISGRVRRVMGEDGEYRYFPIEEDKGE